MRLLISREKGYLIKRFDDADIECIDKAYPSPGILIAVFCDIRRGGGVISWLTFADEKENLYWNARSAKPSDRYSGKYHVEWCEGVGEPDEREPSKECGIDILDRADAMQFVQELRLP